MPEKFQMLEVPEKTNIEHATVNILIELDGNVYLTAMKSDKLDAINLLIKTASEHLVITGKTQAELLKFLGYKEGNGDA